MGVAARRESCYSAFTLRDRPRLCHVLSCAVEVSHLDTNALVRSFICEGERMHATYGGGAAGRLPYARAVPPLLPRLGKILRSPPPLNRSARWCLLLYLAP